MTYNKPMRPLRYVNGTQNYRQVWKLSKNSVTNTGLICMLMQILQDRQVKVTIWCHVTQQQGLIVFVD
jgi:hypothetical protein